MTVPCLLFHKIHIFQLIILMSLLSIKFIVEVFLIVNAWKSHTEWLLIKYIWFNKKMLLENAKIIFSILLLYTLIITPINLCINLKLFLTLALCSTFAFLSSRRLTTSVLPWKQAKVRAVFRLVSIWAFMSEPMSNRSLTAAVCPFIAANIRGEMPNLLPVLGVEVWGEQKGNVHFKYPRKIRWHYRIWFQDIFKIFILQDYLK